MSTHSLRSGAASGERSGAGADRSEGSRAPFVTRGEVVAAAVAAVALALGVWVFRRALESGEPRVPVVQRIRNEASPTRDVVIFTDEAPHLAALVSPVPALWGTPPLGDLTGLRRLYVVSRSPAGFEPVEARLGPASQSLAPFARRWDLDGRATVVSSLATTIPDGVTARREGGAIDGPCNRAGTDLRCRASEDWYHVRAEEHLVGGTSLRCVFAHPHPDGRLVIETPVPQTARKLVGVVAMDDRAYFPAGAPVTNHIRFQPTSGSAVELDVVAPNKRGATPYALDLGGRPGTLSFTISAANAGARQYCFTAHLTR